MITPTRWQNLGWVTQCCKLAHRAGTPWTLTFKKRPWTVKPYDVLRLLKYVRTDHDETKAQWSMTSGELPMPTLEKVVHELVTATIDKQELGVRWIDDAYAEHGHGPTWKQTRLQ